MALSCVKVFDMCSKRRWEFLMLLLNFVAIEAPTIRTALMQNIWDHCTFKKVCKQNSPGDIMLCSTLKCILKFTMTMQNMENNSHLSPYVLLLWSVLLDWEKWICLLIGLFQISGEIPTTTDDRSIHSPNKAHWGTFSGWCIWEQ